MSNTACHVTSGAKLFGFNSYTTMATLCFMSVLVLEKSVTDLTKSLHDKTDERQRRHRKARDFNTQRNHADPHSAKRVFQLLEETVVMDADIERLLKEMRQEEDSLNDLHSMLRLVMRLHEAEERQFPVLRLVRKRAALRQETTG